MPRSRAALSALAVAAALTIGLPAASAEAAPPVVGHGGSTLSCNDGTSKVATVDLTITAPTEEQLDGPDAKLRRVDATNPCAFTLGFTISVENRRGQPLQLGFNVSPGHSATLTKGRLASYGVGSRYTFTNSYGSQSSPVVPGPGVKVVATF